MKTIWKYPLDLRKQPNTIPIPQGAKFRSLIEQYGNPTAYFEVDDEAPNREICQFFIYGTGHRIDCPPYAEYLGTVSTSGGQLIWHIYFNRAAVL